MRYYATFAYPGEPAWVEQFKSESDRRLTAYAALQDGCTIIRVWEETAPLTIKSLNVKTVRSRRHFLNLRRLIAHGWLK